MSTGEAIFWFVVILSIIIFGIPSSIRFISEDIKNDQIHRESIRSDCKIVLEWIFINEWSCNDWTIKRTFFK